MNIKSFRISLGLTFALPLAIAHFLSLGLVSFAATADRDKAIATMPTTAAQKRDRDIDPKISTTQSTTKIVKPNYTGVVKRVDAIAQQITVRIENKEGNGSGVIVAKDGDNYYVATAAHVVQGKEGYVLTTPSQERISLGSGQIDIVNKDLDIAIVKFKSKQNYRIAEIGNYQFESVDWVFLSGFPGRDRNKQRRFEIGRVIAKNDSEFLVKNEFSLKRGNNLIYTNLSLPGMSGGVVLDRQGRLVGINTGVENEAIDNQGKYEEINFGFALGIPIATVIGTADRGQLPPTKLQVSTPVPVATQSENIEILRSQLSAISRPSQTSRAKEWLDYGNLLWRSSQYEKSVTAFEKAIYWLKNHPEVSWHKEQLRTAYFGLGFTWFTLSARAHIQELKQQDLQAAVVAFQQAVKVDDGFYQSWRYLGRTLYELQRHQEALTAYQRAIEKGRDNFILYVEQGDVLRDLKRNREAINSYDLALKLKPNHPWAYLNRGLVYSSLGQYREAIADYNRTIELNPQEAMAYVNRGVDYDAQAQLDRAMADYNQAIKIDPKLAMAYNNRGILYKKKRQYPAAMVDFTTAIQLDPLLAMAYLNRGTIDVIEERYSQAIADLTTAIKLNPQYADAYHLRGIVYGVGKKLPAARKDLDLAVKLYRAQNNQDGYKQAMAVLQMLGK